MDTAPHKSGFRYAPPSRYQAEQVLDVVCGCHHRDEVEDSTVCVLLTLQAFEGISITLDLVPRDVTVYDRQVSPRRVAANRKFVDDQRTGVGARVTAHQLGSQCWTYLAVAHVDIID